MPAKIFGGKIEVGHFGTGKHCLLGHRAESALSASGVIGGAGWCLVGFVVLWWLGGAGCDSG